MLTKGRFVSGMIILIGLEKLQKIELRKTREDTPNFTLHLLSFYIVFRIFTVMQTEISSVS